MFHRFPSSPRPDPGNRLTLTPYRAAREKRRVPRIPAFEEAETILVPFFGAGLCRGTHIVVLQDRYFVRMRAGHRAHRVGGRPESGLLNIETQPQIPSTPLRCGQDDSALGERAPEATSLETRSRDRFIRSYRRPAFPYFGTSSHSRAHTLSMGLHAEIRLPLHSGLFVPFSAFCVKKGTILFARQPFRAAPESKSRMRYCCKYL